MKIILSLALLALAGCVTVPQGSVFPALKCPANATPEFCKAYTRSTQVMILQGVL